MNHKYRKKPIVIEAFQMTRERRQNNIDWPNWLHKAWNKEHDDVGSVYPVDWPDSDGTDRLIIKTLEGEMKVRWDDYIIQGVQGELYPCKPEIFEATYVQAQEKRYDEIELLRTMVCKILPYARLASHDDCTPCMDESVMEECHKLITSCKCHL